MVIIVCFVLFIFVVLLCFVLVTGVVLAVWLVGLMVLLLMMSPMASAYRCRYRGLIELVVVDAIVVVQFDIAWLVGSVVGLVVVLIVAFVVVRVVVVEAFSLR
jgi:hypothetical protein